MNNHKEFFEALGYFFPRSSEELEQFNTLNKDFAHKSKLDRIDPVKVFDNHMKVSSHDYFKRIVLAAEIVYQLHHEKAFGHLKLQKLMFLCQQAGNISIYSNFSKQAMGPYDPKLSRSIDKKLKDNGWFEYTKPTSGYPYFKPLEKMGEHRSWYLKYFESSSENIEWLINTFRKTKSDDVELVATVFACLQEIKKGNQILSDALIVQKVYAWSSLKKKFSEQNILNTYKWMIEVGLTPK